MNRLKLGFVIFVFLSVPLTAAYAAQESTGWNVNLPVNKSGEPSGRSLSWDAGKNYAPWFVVKGRTVSLKKPRTGALTPSKTSGASTRTELGSPRFKDGDLQYRIKLEGKVGSNLTIGQSRAPGAELYQIRANDDGTVDVNLDNYRKWCKGIKVNLSRPIAIRTKIRHHKSVWVSVNGTVCEGEMTRRYTQSEPYQWKLGLYGGGQATSAVITDLKGTQGCGKCLTTRASAGQAD